MENIYNNLIIINNQYVLKNKNIINNINKNVLIKFLDENNLIINLNDFEFIEIKKEKIWHKIDCANNNYKINIYKIFKKEGSIFNYINVLQNNPFNNDNKEELLKKSTLILEINPNSPITLFQPYGLIFDILYKTTTSYYKFTNIVDFINQLKLIINNNDDDE